MHLMEESAEEAQHREDTLKMYGAMEEALRIISDISMNTVNTPTPAPVNNDWLAVPQSSGPSYQNGGPPPR